MDLLGKPTITPTLYYSGKTIGYLLLLVPFILEPNEFAAQMTGKPWYLAIVYLISATGFIMIAMGLLVLGDSTRVGLPKEETTLKTGGIYKFTRNPIYVGLHILLLAVILYTLSIWVTALAIYSIAIYHLIIQSEERFLKQRFGSDYEAYLLNTSRYIKGIL